MSFELNRLFSNDLQKYTHTSNKKIKTDIKSVKKQTCKALNETTKELDKKIKKLKAEITITSPSESYQAKNKIQKIKALKRELKTIKANIGKAKNDHEKIMQFSTEALKKIQTINSNQGTDVNLRPLNSRITTLKRTASDKMLAIFNSVNNEVLEQKKEKQINDLALIDKVIQQFTSSIFDASTSEILNSEPNFKAFSEGTRLEKTALNLATILETKKALNLTLEKLNMKLMVLKKLSEQMPEDVKKKHKAHIKNQIEKFNSLKSSLVENLDSSKDALAFKSNAAKLIKNSENLVKNLSKIPAISISETKLTLDIAIESLKAKKLEIENLQVPQKIKQQLVADIESQIRKMTDQFTRNPELSKKEAAEFVNIGKKLTFSAKVFLRDLPFMIVESECSFISSNMFKQEKGFKNRKDIPQKMLHEALIKIETMNFELNVIKYNMIFENKNGKSLEKHHEFLSKIKEFERQQNKVIEDTLLAAMKFASIEDEESLSTQTDSQAEIQASPTNDKVAQNIASNLKKALLLKKTLIDELEIFELQYLTIPQKISNEFYLIEHHLAKLQEIVPQENTLEAAEKFEKAVTEAEIEIDELFNSIDGIHESESTKIDQKIDSLEADKKISFLNEKLSKMKNLVKDKKDALIQQFGNLPEKYEAEFFPIEWQILYIEQNIPKEITAETAQEFALIMKESEEKILKHFKNISEIVLTE